MNLITFSILLLHIVGLFAQFIENIRVSISNADKVEFPSYPTIASVTESVTLDKEYNFFTFLKLIFDGFQFILNHWADFRKRMGGVVGSKIEIYGQMSADQLAKWISQIMSQIITLGSY